MLTTIKGFTKGIWDQISPEDDLTRRFHYLNRSWYEFLKTAVSSLELAPADGINRTPREYIQLLNNKLNLESGVKNAAYKVKNIMSGYFNTCKHHRSQTGNDIDNASLAENGFDEETYKTVLYNMSVYLAAVAELEIPQKIIDCSMQKSIYEDPGISIDESDMSSSPCDRFPLAFIIDTSSSMSGFLPELQEGMKNLIGLIHDDEQLRQQVELYVTTTTGQKLIDFSTIKELEKLSESLNLRPCMAPARIVDTLKASVEDLKKKLKSIDYHGVDRYCPWIIIISNGNWIPKYNEGFDEMAETVKKDIEEQEFKIYVRTLKEPADMNEAQRERVSRLDPNFEALREMSKFIKTAFQSICRMKVTSPSCGYEMELSKNNP